MLNLLRMMRNDGDEDVFAHPDIENDLVTDEQQRYVSPGLKEDLARISSLFLVLLLIKVLFFLIGLIRPGWLTDFVNQVGFDSLLVFCSSIWMVVSGRFLGGLAVIFSVLLSQLLAIGGLFERNTLSIGLAVASDSLYLSVGALLAMFFRRW